MENEALDFINPIYPKAISMNDHHKFILNIDQWRKDTLKNGNKIVCIRNLPWTLREQTLALTATSSKKILTPMMIYKGAPGPCMEKLELHNLPPTLLHYCLINAWVDVMVMLCWAEKDLRPYVEKASDQITPIIFLESY